MAVFKSRGHMTPKVRDSPPFIKYHHLTEQLAHQCGRLVANTLRNYCLMYCDHTLFVIHQNCILSLCVAHWRAAHASASLSAIDMTFDAQES